MTAAHQQSQPDSSTIRVQRRRRGRGGVGQRGRGRGRGGFVGRGVQTPTPARIVGRRRKEAHSELVTPPDAIHQKKRPCVLDEFPSQPLVIPKIGEFVIIDMVYGATKHPGIGVGKVKSVDEAGETFTMTSWSSASNPICRQAVSKRWYFKTGTRATEYSLWCILGTFKKLTSARLLPVDAKVAIQV